MNRHRRIRTRFVAAWFALLGRPVAYRLNIAGRVDFAEMPSFFCCENHIDGSGLKLS